MRKVAEAAINVTAVAYSLPVVAAAMWAFLFITWQCFQGNKWAICGVFFLAILTRIPMDPIKWWKIFLFFFIYMGAGMAAVVKFDLEYIFLDRDTMSFKCRRILVKRDRLLKEIEGR